MTETTTTPAPTYAPAPVRVTPEPPQPFDRHALKGALIALRRSILAALQVCDSLIELVA